MYPPSVLNFKTGHYCLLQISEPEYHIRYLGVPDSPRFLTFLASLKKKTKHVKRRESDPDPDRRRSFVSSCWSGQKTTIGTRTVLGLLRRCSQWLPMLRRGPSGSLNTLLRSLKLGSSSSSERSSGRCIRLTLNRSGVTVTPALPRKLGSDSPSGSFTSKLCSNEVKNKKISIRARVSPRHIRLPTPKGMKYSGFCTLPSGDKKRDGWKVSGSCQSSGSMWTACSRGTTCVRAGITKPFSVTSLQKEFNRRVNCGLNNVSRPLFRREPVSSTSKSKVGRTKMLLSLLLAKYRWPFMRFAVSKVSLFSFSFCFTDFFWGGMIFVRVWVPFEKIGKNEGQDCYLVVAWVVPRGTMLDHRNTSKIVASVIGRYGMSLRRGILDLPTTWSSSSCTALAASGLCNISTTAHSRVVFTVSIPPENKSPMICCIWRSETNQTNSTFNNLFLQQLFFICSFFSKVTWKKCLIFVVFSQLTMIFALEKFILLSLVLGLFNLK